MKRLSIMVVAGEASGDTLAAELVLALRQELILFQARPTADVQPLFASLEPRFFGAGGPRMAAAGVELAVDMTAHTVFGLTDVLRRLGHFWRLRNRLRDLAIARQPDVIICVDFSGFNRRLARAVKDHVRAGAGTFHDWDPKIVQFVSPQVWASRPGRATAMSCDLDLLLSIFPFEQAWYAERVPQLRVEYVGHPMLDRYAPVETSDLKSAAQDDSVPARPEIVLLPGSRVKELKRHLPVIAGAARIIQASQPAAWRMVLPNAEFAESARASLPPELAVTVQAGGLARALARADLAIASSGTVTMECAYFGVPTVVLYKLSRAEFEVARRMVRVKHIAMPNLLAGETVFPEFIQQEATPAKVAAAALDLLKDAGRRGQVRARLVEVMASLGGGGAAGRAARAVLGLLVRGPEMRRVA
jgi:lipid-A-disaccharide synthase